MWRRFSLVGLVTVLFLAILAPAALGAYSLNRVLPNDCRIDAYNSYSDHYNTVKGLTDEDFNCDKVATRLRFYDPNNSSWVTHESGYRSNTASVSRLSDRNLAWTDHNGRAQGTDWGFRLYG